MKCPNCSDDCGYVSVSIPCPECKGGGINEIDALRTLAEELRILILVKESASWPSSLLAASREVDKAQGCTPLFPEGKQFGYGGIMYRNEAKQHIKYWRKKGGA